MSNSRNAQINALRQQFPGTVVVRESAAESLLKVDHDVRLSPTMAYGLTLFVKVPSAFPKTAPIVTLPYCFHTVPIYPPNITPSESAAYTWNPAASQLVDAVKNAFQHAADRWGSVEPPTMVAVARQLAGETDTLLQDITTNPNCLDAYCYQMPVVKAMRDASRQTIVEVERIANENVQLRPAVEQLQREVENLQRQLQDNVDAVKKADSNQLLAAVCTPEALLQTLEADVRKLSEACRTVGCTALAAYRTDKGSFHRSLDEFKAKSKQMHLVDLKRRAYRQQQQQQQQAATS